MYQMSTVRDLYTSVHPILTAKIELKYKFAERNNSGSHKIFGIGLPTYPKRNKCFKNLEAFALVYIYIFAQF